MVLPDSIEISTSSLRMEMAIQELPAPKLFRSRTFSTRPVFDIRLGYCSFHFFFFQAEDGIRDLIVTGVQTCALPIYAAIPKLFWTTTLSSDTRGGGDHAALSQEDARTSRRLKGHCFSTNGGGPSGTSDRKSVV